MKIEAKVQDLATPRLRALLAKVSPAGRRPLMADLGGHLARRLREHFVAREQGPSKRAERGWPSQHWWAREVREKTALAEVTADRAVVTVASRQFRARLLGAVIRPGPGKKYLAIPTRAESYGRRPSERGIVGAFVARLRGRLYIAAREGKALRVYWRLVRQVRLPADPQALPPIPPLQAELEQRAAEWIARGGA
jgi:hypothetical protein